MIRGGYRTCLYQRLIGQKIAAVNGVVEVLGSAVAFTFLIFRGVDAALRANGMERFTGTIENKSTGTPASATRMVAINPARPPPTTIILGCLIC